MPRRADPYVELREQVAGVLAEGKRSGTISEQQICDALKMSERTWRKYKKNPEDLSHRSLCLLTKILDPRRERKYFDRFRT